MTHNPASLLLAVAARLGQLLRTAPMYPDHHPALDTALDALAERLGAALDALGPTRFLLASPHFLAGDTTVRIPTDLEPMLNELQRVLNTRGVGGFRLLGPADARELMRLARTLIDSDPAVDATPEALAEALARAGVAAVVPLPRGLPAGAVDAAAAGVAATEALRVYLRGVRAIGRLLDDGPTPALVVELKAVADALHAELERSPARALALATPRQVVPYLLRHPVHMAILSMAIGRRLGLSDAAQRDVALAALLADAGMAVVPPEVRNRTGPLSAEDRAAIERHPGMSVVRLMALPGLDGPAAARLRVAFEHHLGLDLSGYPAVARWGGLHPWTRIIAVADVYDALRANRPGRPGRSIAEALSTLEDGAGTQYDPVVVGQFAALVRAAQAGGSSA